MARTRSTQPGPATRPSSGGTVDEALKDGGTPAAQAPPAPGRVEDDSTERTPPPLPTTRTSAAGILETKTVLLYGPAGIGKSTLASEWAGGNVFFFDTGGELNELDVFSVPIGSWRSFREYSWSLADTNASRADDQGLEPFNAACIDTADMLGTLCAQNVRRKLGIAHESDAEWGKGWTTVREDFQLGLAKLSALPNIGVLLVSHDKDVEIKTRTASYNKSTPTLTGGVREAVVNMADLVLFISHNDDGDRVIYTKPNQYYDAKERSKVPRLPAEIAWPLGANGYEVLRDAWYAKEGK